MWGGSNVRPARGQHLRRRVRWWPCAKARFQEHLVRDWSGGDVPHSAHAWAVPALLWASLLTGIAFLRREDVRLNLEAFLEERCSVTVSGQGREHSPGHNLLCPPTLRQGPATSLEVEEGQRLPSLPGLPAAWAHEHEALSPPTRVPSRVRLCPLWRSNPEVSELVRDEPWPHLPPLAPACFNLGFSFPTPDRGLFPLETISEPRVKAPIFRLGLPLEAGCQKKENQAAAP